MSLYDAFTNFMKKEYNIEMEKQQPPGPPPRPGLSWKPTTSRWIRHRKPEPISPGRLGELARAKADPFVEAFRQERDKREGLISALRGESPYPKGETYETAYRKVHGKPAPTEG